MLFLWEENYTTSFNFSFRPACRPSLFLTLTALSVNFSPQAASPGLRRH